MGHEKHSNKFKDEYKSLFNSNQIATGKFGQIKITFERNLHFPVVTNCQVVKETIPFRGSTVTDLLLRKYKCTVVDFYTTFCHC